MIMKNQYYCFISGLPNLSFDDQKEWISIAAFKKMLEDNLHPDDYKQVELVFLNEDHRGLARFLESGEITPGGTGNYTIDDYKEQKEIFSAILPPEDILPGYMVSIMKESLEDSEGFDKVDTEHKLAEGYFHHIMNNGSPFLKAYTEFNYNMNNLLAFIKAGKYGLEQEPFITGSSEHAGHLRNYAGRSLAKDPEFEFFDEILSYTGNGSFAGEEKKYDMLKWNIIDDMIFFEDFSIDRILGYLQQMLILSRWSPLKKESGENRLRNIVHSAWQKPEARNESGGLI